MNLYREPLNEQDRRVEMPNIGIGNFTRPGTLPFFKLHCGIEAKRALQPMLGLPPPQSLKVHECIKTAFQILHKSSTSWSQPGQGGLQEELPHL